MKLRWLPPDGYPPELAHVAENPNSGTYDLAPDTVEPAGSRSRQ